MVRTGNVDFSCKRLTSIEIRKSKYHIIRRVRFRWDPPEKDIWIRAWIGWLYWGLTPLERPRSYHGGR